MEKVSKARRTDRIFFVDPYLCGVGTPDESSEVVVSSGHLDREVELLEYLDGRWFICFFADVPGFCWAREVPVLRHMRNQVLDAGGIVVRTSAGG